MIAKRALAGRRAVLNISTAGKTLIIEMRTTKLPMSFINLDKAKATIGNNSL